MGAPESTALSGRSHVFDRLARGWSQIHYGPGGGLVPRIARFADALDSLVPPSSQILDFGCGTGDIAAGLAARGFKVHAVDPSAKMVEQAKRIHDGSGVTFGVIVPDMEVSPTGPFAGQPFDAVVCSSVLEYVPDPPTSLRFLESLLKPGGWLLATVPNIQHRFIRREDRHRLLMRLAPFRAFIGLTRWREGFELQALSNNRFPASKWAALLAAAQLRPVWRDCEDHPLTLLIGRKSR
jgi:2-polyprenyl-3-methyl-5-hydroxy-6-metoxy-1,4-benzoquinol methylase